MKKHGPIIAVIVFSFLFAGCNKPENYSRHLGKQKLSISLGTVNGKPELSGYDNKTFTGTYDFSLSDPIFKDIAKDAKKKDVNIIINSISYKITPVSATDITISEFNLTSSNMTPVYNKSNFKAGEEISDNMFKYIFGLLLLEIQNRGEVAKIEVFGGFSSETAFHGENVAILEIEIDMTANVGK